MIKRGKVIASIEARYSATRLPGKVMLEINGKPMLALMIERVKMAKSVEDIVIATSINPDNDVIEKLAKELHIECYRGSEDDVLDRVLKAAQMCKADHIIELWGDSPLIDPNIIDSAVDHYFKHGYDCVGTCLDHTFPLGMSLLVFPTRILNEVASTTNDPVDRENVSNYIYEHPEKYKTGNLPCPKELFRQDIRLTVDERNDFELIKNIFEHFQSKESSFGAKDVISYLDKNPDLLNINRNVKQKILRKT